MGTMVIALEPQGNPFGLLAVTASTPASQIHNEPGALAWNEAMVGDTAAAKRVLLRRLRVHGFEQMRRRDGRSGMD